MKSGGFTLLKWNSDSREVRERIAKEQTFTASNVGSVDTSNDPVITENAVLPPSTPPKSKEMTQVKILGLNWDVHTDELKCETTELIAYAKSLPITKRSVLKISAKIFDPLGLLSPFTIKMKILFQILCNRRIDCDTPLSGEHLTQWKEIMDSLTVLHELKVPRCYFNATGENLHHEIHGFSDASEKAYSAVVYLKTEYPNGKVEVVLIASKTRVAPISKQTIPRPELLGALILARLVKTILRAFKSIKVDDVFLWTNSLTTLCWIKNNKNWKQNRVNEIRELTNKEQWRHCPGHMNPEDLPSRVCNGMDLVRHESWSSGPDFLQQPKEQWPVEHQTTQDDDKLAFTELVKHPPPVSYSLTTHSDMARKSVVC